MKVQPVHNLNPGKTNLFENYKSAFTKFDQTFRFS